MSEEENILLSKWLNHTISPEELKLLEQEVDLVALKETLDLQKQYDLDLKEPELMWTEFQQKTDIDSTKEKDSINVSHPKINHTKRLLIVAAIFAIALIAYLIFKSYSAPTEINTSPKQTIKKDLADGTSIQLSPATKIIYDEKDWDTERKIELKGQAFFEVSKGLPFSVKTNRGIVEVLGTSFDIWSSGDYMMVQCFEGEVRVRDIKSGKTVNLTKGMQVNLNKTGLAAVENFDEISPGWVEKNQQIYKSIPVGLVVRDIRRFLGLRVETGQINLEAQFSGLIPYDNPEATARYLAESMGWKYVITSDGIQFSN